jgi:hypothetical protein
MEAVFKAIGFENMNPTFQDIFSKDLCQKVLLHYWNYIFDDSLYLFDMRNDPQKVLRLVLSRYHGKRMNLYKIFGIAGLILCSKDDDGTIGVRNILEFYKPKHNWSKTRKWIEEFKKDQDRQYLHGFIKDIQIQLNTFMPLRIEDERSKTEN